MCQGGLAQLGPKFLRLNQIGAWSDPSRVRERAHRATRVDKTCTPSRETRVLADRSCDQRNRAQTALVHARHLRAAAGMISLHSGHSFVGGPAGAGVGLRIAFVIRNTQRAMITKSTMFPKNAP
jgi:hypothetical protein